MTSTPRQAQYLWLLALLGALTLFPFGWVAELVPAFDAMAGALFSTARAHAVGHATLFFLLGLALLLTFPALRRRPWLFIALILAAGIGQEGFQLAYKQRPVVPDDLRDLVTDLVGAAAAFGVIHLARALRINR